MESLCWAAVSIITKYLPHHVSKHQASDAHENRVCISSLTPDTVAERSKACTVFARSEAGIVDSNPNQGMDAWSVFVCVFLFVLSCV
jgi:hypothetical protein